MAKQDKNQEGGQAQEPDYKARLEQLQADHAELQAKDKAQEQELAKTKEKLAAVELDFTNFKKVLQGKGRSKAFA